MKDLTAAQTIELEQLVAEFVQDRRLDGFDVIVILEGRGLDRLAFPLEMAREAPDLLARAYRTAKKRNAREAN